MGHAGGRPWHGGGSEPPRLRAACSSPSPLCSGSRWRAAPRCEACPPPSSSPPPPPPLPPPLFQMSNFSAKIANVIFSRSFMGASKRDVDMTGSIILTVSTAPQNVASARTACPPPSSPDVAQLRGEGGTQRAILAPIYIYIYIQIQRAFCPSMRWSRHSSRSRAAWLSHAAMSTHAREDEREEDEGRGSD